MPLTYRDSKGTINGSAGVWSFAPLTTAVKALNVYVQDYAVEPATMQRLRWLRGLTRLELRLSAAARSLPASPAELGAILQSLTALQEMAVFGCPGSHLLPPALAPVAAADIQDAVRAVLDVLASPTSDAGMALLAMVAADAVEAVEAAEAELGWGDPAEVAAVIARTDQAAAVQLRHLAVELGFNPPEQQLVAPNMQPLCLAIGQLPKLVSLKLKGQGFILEAVEPLTRATQLTQLTVAGTVSLNGCLCRNWTVVKNMGSTACVFLCL